MNYGKVEVSWVNPQPHDKYKSLIIVGKLKAELLDGGKLVRTINRNLYKLKDGSEIFSSWWNLARDKGAI